MHREYILFVDSGMGGLSIVKALQEKAHNYNYLYYADVEHFPYGKKTSEEIVQYILDIYNSLSRRYAISLMVIACNTASVTALSILREQVRIPIIGTVPAIKKAAELFPTEKIGVIATETTVKNGYLAQLINEFSSEAQVIIRAAPKLVHAIEHTTTKETINAIINEELRFFKEQKVKALVLGCTHYSFVFDEINVFFQHKVHIIDSQDGVSNRIIKVLNTQCQSKKSHTVLFISASEATNYKVIAKKYNLFDEIYIKDGEWKKDSFSGDQNRSSM